MTSTASSVPAFVFPLARLLLAAMFVQSGFDKLTHLDATAAFIAAGGLPLAPVMAPLVGAFELLAGLAVVVGWQARTAGLLLALFTLVASFLFHRYWAVHAEQAFTQQLLFMKNVAVAGGMLLLFAAGPGALSLRVRGGVESRAAGD
ncbi:MAG: DoxX family protein [Rubrivivax sp.]|nr:DoxX family protein [Rubrivivax sp.]